MPYKTERTECAMRRFDNYCKRYTRSVKIAYEGPLPKLKLSSDVDSYLQLPRKATIYTREILHS
jgi:hypothetical protein